MKRGQMRSNNYVTITGRELDLTKLTGKERSFLAEVLGKYQTGPDWSKFALWWLHKFGRAALAEDSLAWRICQDLEARLGIAQGKVALPDYRDYLMDLIEEKYGSRYRFCKETGFDQGYLSRILAGRSGLTLEALGRFLDLLDSELVLKRKQELRAETAYEEAGRVLSSALSR